MNLSFIVTLVGADRPGLVNALAERAAANGANWLDSSMAHLAGKFAGIVRLDVAEADADRLEAALRALSSAGLSLSIERGAAVAGVCCAGACTGSAPSTQAAHHQRALGHNRVTRSAIAPSLAQAAKTTKRAV